MKVDRKSRLAQWIEDLRWSANMCRVRRMRRELIFSRRRIFDDALRPEATVGTIIAYPDAFYHVRIDDVCRAISEAMASP